MKNKSMIYSLLLAGLLMLTLYHCKKEPRVTVLNTSAVTNISETTAISGGNITVEGDAIISRGVCWSTFPNPTTADSKTIDGPGSGSFTSLITGLSRGATYYIMAYAVTSKGTTYGNKLMFSASLSTLPVLTTTKVTNITITTATSGGNITSDGGGTITARGLCWTTNDVIPTIADSKTSNGTGIGSFTTNLTLNEHSIYWIRAYATNSAGTAYGDVIDFITLLEGASNTILFNPNLTYGTVTDVDGNVYKTIQIGTQIWMAENLKTTKFRNGDPIPNIADVTAWGNLTTGAYCWYNNDAATYKEFYGALYNWYAVNDSRSIAPTGWHVATQAELTTLSTSLGGGNVGGKLKEAGVTHWFGPNLGATNESGFTALPGSPRYPSGGFDDLPGYGGYFFTSTEFDAGKAQSYFMGCVYNTNLIYPVDKKWGYSVRCIKD